MPTDLSPVSTTSALILPATGTHSDVTDALAFGIYSTAAFVSGAVDQVSYVYGKLGGNVLDIELETANIYKAYEEACLEYSYIVICKYSSISLTLQILSELSSTGTHFLKFSEYLQ